MRKKISDMEKSMTGQLPIEIIYNILMDLSYSDTMNYCSTNREGTVICNDELFWKRKLDHKYTSSNGMKPSDYTKYSMDTPQYRNLYRKWETEIELPVENIVTSEVMMFRLSTSTSPVMLGQNHIIHIIKVIVRNGSVLALEDLINRGIIPRDRYWKYYLMKDAIIYNRIPILHWSERNGLLYNAFAMRLDGIMRDYPNLSIDVLEWLKTRNILPSALGLGFAVFHDRFDIAQWLINNGIIPQDQSVDAIIHNDNPPGTMLNKLEWFAQHGILPGEGGIGFFIVNNSESSILDLFNWLESKGFVPYQSIFILALSHHLLNVLQWMEQRHYLPNTQTANEIATEYNDPFMLQYLALRGIYPTPEAIAQAIDNNEFRTMISWLINDLPKYQSTFDPSSTFSPFSPSNPKIKNPLTGRLISVGGLAYNTLVKKGIIVSGAISPSSPGSLIQTMPGSLIQTMPGQNSNEIINPDDPSKALNPVTNRWIVRGGNKYNELVRRGLIVPR